MSALNDVYFSRTAAWMQQAVRWSTNPNAESLIRACGAAAPRLLVADDAVQSVAGRMTARLAARVLSRVFPGLEIAVRRDESFASELEEISTQPLGRRVPGCVPFATLVVGASEKVRDEDAVFVGTNDATAILAPAPVKVAARPFAPASLMAGALGAAEVSKLFLRAFLPGFAGRWTSWDLAPTGACAVPVTHSSHPLLADDWDLGRFLIISGGALTHAVMAALLEVPRISGHGLVLDDQSLEPSNGNRYLLLPMTDALQGAGKAAFIARLSRPGLVIEARSDAYARGSAPYPLVLIGADRISARLDAQRDDHQTIINGATELDLARVSVHSSGSAAACLGCINPAEDPPDRSFAPTIAFVSAAAGAFVAAAALEVAAGVRVPGTVIDLKTLLPHLPGNFSREVRAAASSCVLGCAQRAA